jgi:hypothetical protein
LNNTLITDAGLQQLKTLQQLQSLNVVGTNVSAKGLLQLKNLKQLRSLFLYKTLIAQQDWDALKKNFPQTQLDSGGYVVPLLETDTTIVTANPSK